MGLVAREGEKQAGVLTERRGELSPCRGSDRVEKRYFDAQYLSSKGCRHLSLHLETHVY